MYYGGIISADEHTNNSCRDIVLSADMCYNWANEKPRPLGEVAAKPTERAKRSRQLSMKEPKTCPKRPLTRYRGSSPKGRAFL